MLETVVFYGASRFEAPEPGHTFRQKDGRILSVVLVKSEYIAGGREGFVPKAWKFVAECRELKKADLSRFGRENIEPD